MNTQYIGILTGLLLLTGCAAAPSKPAAEPGPPANAQTDQIANKTISEISPAKPELPAQAILACDYYSKAETENQKKQLADTQQLLTQLKQSPNKAEQTQAEVMARIKLACIYALPSSHLKDYTKANGLLLQLRDDATVGLVEKAYVNHLYLFNAENIRQQQKMKEEARTMDSLTQKYDSLQKKHEANEQKLMQLKNIEKSLNLPKQK